MWFSEAQVIKWVKWKLINGNQISEQLCFSDLLEGFIMICRFLIRRWGPSFKKSNGRPLKGLKENILKSFRAFNIPK